MRSAPAGPVTPEREAHLLHIIDVWKNRAKTARAEGFKAGLEVAAKAVRSTKVYGFDALVGGKSTSFDDGKTTLENVARRILKLIKKENP